MSNRPASPLGLMVAVVVLVMSGVVFVAVASQKPTSASNFPPGCPDGKCPLAPSPRVPWGEPRGDGALKGGSIIAGRSYGGEELSADLPGADHFKNIGSKKDGLGECVPTSIEMAARWQGLEQMRGWRDWCATNYGGGGYPSKVEQLIKAWCKAKNVPVPEYAQYEGQTPDQILDLVDRTRRMACITYGTSPRYGGKTIAHMVCAPKCGGKYGVVLDNNFPGESNYEWMDRAELVKRIKHPSGKAWVFVWLAASPPPPPYN